MITPPPAPPSGQPVVGLGNEVSAPLELSGSYTITVHSVDCGGQTDLAQLAHLQLVPASDSSLPSQRLYELGQLWEPTNLPAGQYVVTKGVEEVPNCYFDIVFTPR